MFKNYGMDKNVSDVTVYLTVENKSNENFWLRFLILYIYTVEATVFVSFITWTSLWKRKENGRATEKKADTEGRSVTNLLEMIWYKRWRCI